jgi:fibronectin type 3 domain-containing protein
VAKLLNRLGFGQHARNNHYNLDLRRVCGFRVATSLAGLLAVCLCVAASGTVGVSARRQTSQEKKSHSVTLHWDASRTPVAGYNVYRSTKSGRDYMRINSKPVTLLSYVDADAKSGETYYYVTRGVTADGKESANSNEMKVTVP